MILRDATQVKYSFKAENNNEIEIVVPDVSVRSDQWEFVDVIYQRTSNTSPIDLIISAQFSDVEFVIRKVSAFSGLSFYFQLNKEFDYHWSVKFYTVGAAGQGYDHYAALFWR